MLRPARAYIWDWRNSGQRSVYLNTPIWASAPSVGKPPSIECTAATACTIPPCLLGQACLGWMVTTALGCPGTISNRPVRSSDTDHVSTSSAADNGAYAPLTVQSSTSCAVTYGSKGGACLAHAIGYALPRMKRRSDHLDLGFLKIDNTTAKCAMSGIADHKNSGIEEFLPWNY